MADELAIEPYVPPSWGELLMMANVALAATADQVVLPADPNAMPLEVGHAAVARSRRLLAGIVALITEDLPDVCGVLIRALYESWLVGIYALLGGPEALSRLVAQQDRHLRPIRAVLGDDGGENGQSLPVEQLAHQVAKLIEERGMPNPQFAIRSYEVLYRWESYRNTHGGLGSIEGHVARYPGRTVIARQRPDDDDNVRHRVFVAIAIFISGAQIAAISGGWEHEELDRLAARVQALDPGSR
jgi:hypothetical protein